MLSVWRASRGAWQVGDLSDGLIFDADRMRPVASSEMVKSVNGDLLAPEPGIPWGAVARMRELCYSPLLRHFVVDLGARHEIRSRRCVLRLF
jgi:hypothetical protein